MQPGRILVAEHSGAHIVKFIGDVRCTLCAGVDEYMEEMVAKPGFSRVFIDLSEAENLDSTALGLIAKVGILSKRQHPTPPSIYATDSTINRLLDSMGLGTVFSIRDTCCECEDGLYELQARPCSENELHHTVVEAHRVLMGLNDRNRAEFKDLMDVLEKTDPGRKSA